MKSFCSKFLLKKLNNNSIRNIKFTPRIVTEWGDVSGKEKTNFDQDKVPEIQIFDLSKGDIKKDSLRLDLIQTSLDKLTKKNEFLSEKVEKLEEILTIMSSSIQILSENHINTKVYTILKHHGIIPQDLKQVPFTRGIICIP
jgi:hypothetical protein